MLEQTSDLPGWLAQTLGPLGLLVFLLVVVVYGGVKKLWVFGWAFREMEHDRDMYREMALRGTRAAEKGTEVAGRLADQDLQSLAQLVADAHERKVLP